MKIVAEDKIVDNKINDIIAEWETTRPVQGNMAADTAMNTINIFETKLNRVQEDYDLVCRAKEALDLIANSSSSRTKNSILYTIGTHCRFDSFMYISSLMSL